VVLFITYDYNYCLWRSLTSLSLSLSAHTENAVHLRVSQYFICGIWILYIYCVCYRFVICYIYIVTVCLINKKLTRWPRSQGGWIELFVTHVQCIYHNIAFIFSCMFSHFEHRTAVPAVNCTVIVLLRLRTLNCS